MIKYLTEPFFRYLPNDLAAIAVAMVWGQKSFLTSQQYQVWKTTGLLHLLVLSGQNITLLVGFLQIFSKQLGLYFQLGITVLVALFYLFVFGAEAPIVRASVMAILSSVTIFSQTVAPPLFLLFLTSLVMLSFRPDWLGSLSFQLSFGATLGIMLFYPRLKQWYKKRFRKNNELADMFFVSLSAQTFTTVLLLINFREASLLTLPINTVVAFLVEPIMVVGVLASIIGNLVPFLAPVIFLPLFGLIMILDWLVNLFYPLGVILKLYI